MGECSSSNSLMALANESKHEISSISPPAFCDLGESSVEQMEGGSSVSNIEESIEKSKSHWSQVRVFGSNQEVAEVINVEVFRTLQRHPTWGTFFLTFGEGEGSYGELVLGKKFAEGAQGELYEVQIKWNNPKHCEHDRRNKCEYVLKVFKEGTFLRHLQSQWPQGILQFHTKRLHPRLLPTLRFCCDVYSGTLLEDGRFAFVMVKEDQDLRSMIDQFMMTRPKDMGPFSKGDVEGLMYHIARGMDQLHGFGIVHRDLKASNVLFSATRNYYIADYECSVGVVGTGFFRAPEILEACKHGNGNEKVDLFTKAVDVYSYGMTCYEILTGKLPFEGHPRNEYGFVLQGQRPELPKDVDDWICKLLKRCWHRNPLARPSFGNILKVLLANSEICRKIKLNYARRELEERIRNDLEMHSKMAILRGLLRMVKLMLKY